MPACLAKLDLQQDDQASQLQKKWMALTELAAEVALAEILPILEGAIVNVKKELFTMKIYLLLNMHIYVALLASKSI